MYFKISENVSRRSALFNIKNEKLTCENLGVKVCMEWRRGLTWIQKEVLTQELVLLNHWAKGVLSDWSPITITGRAKQRRQPSSTSQPHPYALQLHWPQLERLWGSALDFSELKILWNWKRKRILLGNLLERCHLCIDALTEKQPIKCLK